MTATLGNPMDLSNPNSQGNYQQPNTANPKDQSALGVATYPVGRDELNLTQPLPPFTQPG